MSRNTSVDTNSPEYLKWEYAILEFNTEDNNIYRLRSNQTLPRERLGNNTPRNSIAFLNAMGQQGWELVCTVQVEKHINYLFKRTKPANGSGQE